MSQEEGEAQATQRFMTIFEHTAQQHGHKTEERQHDYKPRSTDVMVVGPPKTGTTWVQQILHQIRTKGDMSFKDIYDVSWWLPYYFMPVPGFDFNADQPAEPRVLKCHELYKTVPKRDGMKYVMVFRNPNDTSWSYMRFLGGFLGTDTDALSLELMLLTPYTQVCKCSGGVSELVESWWEHRNDPNVLWLYYEDLKADLPYCIERLAEFVGIPLTDDEKRIVIRNCSFDFMVQHKDKFSGDAEVMAKALGIKDWKPKAGMVRHGGGQSGQGSENLPEEVKLINAQAWEERMAPLGFPDYQALYEATSLLNDRKK